MMPSIERRGEPLGWTAPPRKEPLPERQVWPTASPAYGTIIYIIFPDPSPPPDYSTIRTPSIPPFAAVQIDTCTSGV
ncbi:hypothetical protein M404DRAFT_998700, partial [Pisolithus tinctorius Marx 270]